MSGYLDPWPQLPLVVFVRRGKVEVNPGVSCVLRAQAKVRPISVREDDVEHRTHRFVVASLAIPDGCLELDAQQAKSVCIA